MAPQCRYCGAPESGTPNDYYHEKECHANDVRKRMKALDTVHHGQTRALRLKQDEEMDKLQRELKSAEYVGD